MTTIDPIIKKETILPNRYAIVLPPSENGVWNNGSDREMPF
jgi:hypothetical protein